MQDKLHRQVRGLRDVLEALEAEDEHYDLTKMYREDVREVFWLLAAHLRWAMRGLTLELAEKITTATNNTVTPRPQRKDWEVLTWLATLATRERRTLSVHPIFHSHPIYPPSRPLRLRITVLSLLDYNLKSAAFRLDEWKAGLGVTVYLPASRQISQTHFTHSPYFVPEIKERGDRCELFGGYTFVFDIPIPDWRAEGYGRRNIPEAARVGTPVSWGVNVMADRQREGTSAAAEAPTSPVTAHVDAQRRRARRRAQHGRRPNETQLTKQLLAEVGDADAYPYQKPGGGRGRAGHPDMMTPLSLPTSPGGLHTSAAPVDIESYAESDYSPQSPSRAAAAKQGPDAGEHAETLEREQGPMVVLRTARGHACLPLLPMLDGVGVGEPPKAERHGLLLSNRKAQLDVVTEVDEEWWRGWRQECKRREIARAAKRETAYMTHHFLLTQQHVERQLMAECDRDATLRSEGGAAEVATPLPEFSVLERINKAPFKLFRDAHGGQGEGVVQEELGLAHAASTVYGYPPKIALAGGLITHSAHGAPKDKDIQFSSTLYDVNLATGKSEALSPLPVERLHSSLVHYNGRLYLYGGLGWYRRGEETFERSGALCAKPESLAKEKRAPRNDKGRRTPTAAARRRSCFQVIRDDDDIPAGGRGLGGTRGSESAGSARPRSSRTAAGEPFAFNTIPPSPMSHSPHSDVGGQRRADAARSAAGSPKGTRSARVRSGPRQTAAGRDNSYLHLDNVDMCSTDDEAKDDELNSPNGNTRGSSFRGRERPPKSPPPGAADAARTRDAAAAAAATASRKSSRASNSNSTTRRKQQQRDNSFMRSLNEPASASIYSAKDDLRSQLSSTATKKSKSMSKGAPRTFDALLGEPVGRAKQRRGTKTGGGNSKGFTASKRLYQGKDEQESPVLYKTVLEYSYSSQMWTELPTSKGRYLRVSSARDVPLYRAAHTACVYGHYMLVFGGWGLFQSKACPYRSNFLTWLSLKTGRWRSFVGNYTNEGWVSEKNEHGQTAPVPPPRSDHTAVMVKDSMYVCGGIGHIAKQGAKDGAVVAQGGTGRPVSPARKPSSPAPRTQTPTRASFRHVNVPREDVDVDYESSDADTPWARHMKSYATITSHAQALPDLWRYDATTHEWTALPDCPAPLSGHSASVWGETMFVCGGKQAPHVYAFSFPHNTWCVVRTPRTDPKPLRRWGHIFSVHPRVVNAKDRRTVLTICSVGGELVPQTGNQCTKRAGLAFDYPKKPAPDSEEAQAQATSQIGFSASACYHLYEHPVLPLQASQKEVKDVPKGEEREGDDAVADTTATTAGEDSSVQEPKGSFAWSRLRQRVMSQRQMNRQTAAMNVD